MDVGVDVDVPGVDAGAPSSVASGVHAHVAAAVAAVDGAPAIRPRPQPQHTRRLRSDPFVSDLLLVCHSRPVQPQLATRCLRLRLRLPPAPPGRPLQPLPLPLSC